MATTKGTAIAAPQIFTSDPLEQGFAKGITDPDMGGLSYALYNAARGDRATQQQTYMDALHQSNLMASRLAQQELEGDITKELIKSMAEQANAGIDPSTTTYGGRVYKNVNDPLTQQPAFVSRDLKIAQAQKARADAAHALASGDSGAVKFEGTQDYGPGGDPGKYTTKFSGKNPAEVQAAQDRYKASRPPPGTGGPVINPDGSVGGTVATTPQIRAGVPGSQTGTGSDARAQGEAKRRAEAQRTQKQLEQVK